MRYVTYCHSFLRGLSDVVVHDNKEDAVKFYRKNARYYFNGIRIPSKITPPTGCGFFHRMFGIMSIRTFRKNFPEWKGDN